MGSVTELFSVKVTFYSSQFKFEMKMCVFTYWP